MLIDNSSCINFCGWKNKTREWIYIVTNWFPCMHVCFCVHMCVCMCLWERILCVCVHVLVSAHICVRVCLKPFNTSHDCIDVQWLLFVQDAPHIVIVHYIHAWWWASLSICSTTLITLEWVLGLQQHEVTVIAQCFSSLFLHLRRFRQLAFSYIWGGKFFANYIATWIAIVMIM